MSNLKHINMPVLPAPHHNFLHFPGLKGGTEMVYITPPRRLNSSTESKCSSWQHKRLASSKTLLQ